VPVLLRTGAVLLEQLQAVVPKTQLAEGHVAATAKSPGLRHQHYAPKAAVVLIDSEFEISHSKSAAYVGLRPPAPRFELERVCTSVEDYAHSLFEFFRECDRRGIDTIYCEAVEETGIGAALIDRIKRAAVK